MLTYADVCLWRLLSASIQSHDAKLFDFRALANILHAMAVLHIVDLEVFTPQFTAQFFFYCSIFFSAYILHAMAVLHIVDLEVFTAQNTCFIGTKVQILTQKVPAAVVSGAPTCTADVC